MIRHLSHLLKHSCAVISNQFGIIRRSQANAKLHDWWHRLPADVSYISGKMPMPLRSSLFSGGGQSGLFARQPHTQQAPCSDQRHGDEADTPQAEAERVQSPVRPGADLVARTIAEGVDKTLRLVFVLAAQNSKQNFACWAQQCETGRPAHNL